MVGFVIYLVLVWYLAYRFRRRLIGYGVVVMGFAGLVMLGYLHWRMSEWTHGRIYLPVLQVLLYPYTLLVGAGGVFMASMPKMLPLRCATCDYDLAGLEGSVVTCPECGRAHAMAYHRGDPCHGCGEAIDQRRVPGGAVVKCRPCGLVHFVAWDDAVVHGRPARSGRGRGYDWPVGDSAADEAMEHAQKQDEQRQPGRRAPADERQPGGGDVLHDREGAGGGRLGDQIVLPA